MVFAEHIADGTRRLFMLGGIFQSKLAHRIDNAALYWLQTIANMRQRTVFNHVHRVVQIRLLGVGAHGHQLSAIGGQDQFVSHFLYFHIGQITFGL